MLISDEMDFRAQKISRDRETLDIEKRMDPLRRCGDPKCVCTKQKSHKICEWKGK